LRKQQFENLCAIFLTWY